MQLETNGERLWLSLLEMAKIGVTAKGGCNRLAFSQEDRLGRELFLGWCRDAGCQVSVDRIGNMFVRRPGRRDDVPVVMAGSPLDTQPTGAKFDGFSASWRVSRLCVSSTTRESKPKRRRPAFVVEMSAPTPHPFRPSRRDGVGECPIAP